MSLYIFLGTSLDLPTCCLLALPPPSYVPNIGTLSRSTAATVGPFCGAPVQGGIAPALGSEDYAPPAGGSVAFQGGTVAKQDMGTAKVTAHLAHAASAAEGRGGALGGAPPFASSFGCAAAAGTHKAAQFDLSAVPGMYEGRPDRFYEDPLRDPRRESSGGAVVEDSHITRNALAPDLLDLDFGGGGGAPFTGGGGGGEVRFIWRGEGDASHVPLLSRFHTPMAWDWRGGGEVKATCIDATEGVGVESWQAKQYFW